MAFYRETQRRWSEGRLGLNVPAVSPARCISIANEMLFILPLYVIAKKQQMTVLYPLQQRK